MTECTKNPVQARVETTIETTLFASRWIMAPLYIGLIGALVLITLTFFNQLAYYFPKAMSLDPDSVILVALKLVDLTFAASLVLIVIFSGYENFISRLDAIEEHHRPTWMGKVDFSGLKMKLIASVVAISSIHLLAEFMQIGGDQVNETKLKWMAIVHVVFVSSGVLMALMDYLNSLSKKNNKG